MRSYKNISYVCQAAGDSASIYRGTQNGVTADLKSLSRPGYFLHAVQEKGVPLVPPVAGCKTTDQSQEHAHFSGGYTVGCHGDGGKVQIVKKIDCSSRKVQSVGTEMDPKQVDAVQLEFGSTFRSGCKR